MATTDDFDIPTLDAVLRRARDAVQTLERRADLSSGADYDIISRVLSSLVWPVFGFVRFAVQQIFPDSSVLKYLRRHGEQRDIPQKTAAIATGFGLVRGLIGSTQPSTSTLTADSGVELVTTSPGTIAQALWPNRLVVLYDERRPNYMIVSSTTGMSVGDVFGINGNFYVIKDLPGGGAVVIYGRFKVNPVSFPVPDQLFPAPGVRLLLSAKLAGAAGNMAFGVALELANPAIGVDAEVELLEMSGGADDESPKDWARRMQEHDAERAAANNRSQALQTALEYPGVGEAYVYDVYRGLGTADIVPQGVKGARHLSTARITEIQNFYAPRPPTDAIPGIVCIGGHDWLYTDFADFFVPLELVIVGGPGYGPAWIGTLTTAAGCTTTRINTTVDPRATIAIGSRVVIPVGPPLFIEQRAVTSIDATGFGVDVLSFAPVAGRTLRPGSDLIEPLRDAYLDMFDSLGPGDTNPPTRYPAPTTRGPDKLTLNIIHAVGRSVVGLDNLRIIQPALDVLPPPKAQPVPLDIILRY